MKDWQTVRAKYDLAEAFANTYAAEGGKRERLSRSINAKDVFTKERVNAILQKSRQASEKLSTV